MTLLMMAVMTMMKEENGDNGDTAGLEISASCDAMLEEEEPRTMLKVVKSLN